MSPGMRLVRTEASDVAHILFVPIIVVEPDVSQVPLQTNAKAQREGSSD